MERLRNWVVHPLLFSAIPVVSLLAQNLTQVKASIGLRALALSLLMGLLVLWLERLLIGDWRRGAVATSLFLVLFFTYGHVYASLKETEVFGLLIGRHRFLAPLWSGLILVSTWWAVRKLEDTRGATAALNVMGLAALAFPVLQFATYEIQVTTADPAPAVRSAESELTLPAGETPPDIYYIILDAYARDDVLEDFYAYDNEPFLGALEGMGFTVTRCSQSNYAQTELSLATSLNFNYLEALGDDFVAGNEVRTGLAKLIRRNAVREYLKDLGYTDVAFETGYYWTQLDDAKVYLSPATSALDALEVVGGLNSFELLFLKSSGALLITDAASVLPDIVSRAVDYPHQRHRERVLYSLDKLRGIALNIESPKFVFAHIVAPHFPYVFGPEGEVVTYQDPMDLETVKTAYREQLIYLNSRVLPLLEEIIATSRTPPVIVLQGDHGVGESSREDRMAILNAYYLPGDGDRLLYPSISPVNSFRVVFNAYFGGDFPLLEDVSRFSTYELPYDYSIIADPRPGCE